MHEDGLAHFVITAKIMKELDPLLWPALHLTGDNGPDNTCGYFWMLWNDMNVALRADQQHCEWRDVKLSLERAGLWDTVLCLSVVMSLHHKPYDSGE